MSDVRKISTYKLIRLALLCALAYFSVSLTTNLTSTAQEVAFQKHKNSVDIFVGKKKIAEYVFQDPKIKRPYLAHLRTPSGIQSSRNHPPKSGDDNDHGTMHPGIWLAFGDISGHDFWRNKAIVKNTSVKLKSDSVTKGGEIIATHEYFAESKKVCDEICRLRFHNLAEGYLITWDSNFSSNESFYFGDQEEMGLGMRLATPIAEKNGGKMLDSEGRDSAKKIWGKTAKWIDYYGTIDEQTVGQLLIVHPKNFRASWMHARNYGFVAANPFGRKAFGKGAKSKIVMKPNDGMRLRFGVLLHSNTNSELPQFEEVYNRYLSLAK